MVIFSDLRKVKAVCSVDGGGSSSMATQGGRAGCPSGWGWSCWCMRLSQNVPKHLRTVLGCGHFGVLPASRAEGHAAEDNRFMQNTKPGGFCCWVSVECEDQRHMEILQGPYNRR